MIKLFSSDDRMMVHHLFNLLVQQGIECQLKNDQLYTLAGEVPVSECLPEIWLMNMSQKSRAEDILSAIIDSSHHQEDKLAQAWQCPVCSEWHEAIFTQCWKCGYERDCDQE